MDAELDCVDVGAEEAGVELVGLPVLLPLPLGAPVPEAAGLVGLPTVELGKGVEKPLGGGMLGAAGVTAVHEELDELATLIGPEYCRFPIASRIWKVM